jgi:sulfite reductase (ferredoxin)
MSDDRFEELLRRMPEIAKAVNAFQGEPLQRMAFQSLMTAFGIQAPASDAAEQRGQSRAAAAKGTGTPFSTKDILAMARAGQAKSAPTTQDAQAAGGSDAAAPAAAAVSGAVKEQGAAKELSAMEAVKSQSRLLRGTIAEELRNSEDHFDKDNSQLLKFHGAYQQDNRDARSKAGGGKSDKAYMFMVRSKIPGGVLTSDQLLGELDLCDEVGNTTLRITTRQGLQLHGIVKGNLQRTIRRINEIQLTTFAACGDVQRNVMCCPGPYTSAVNQEVQNLAAQLSLHFTPHTRAYYELWLADPNGENRELIGGSREAESEPIYGASYLPRKFKFAIGFPHDNCVDLYTHDLGLLTIVRDNRIAGYNVLVGGGMGVTPSAKKTFPALAHRLAFVTPDEVMDVATSVVKVQRDFGNRSDRKLARLKYLIHNWGLEAFRAKVSEYYGKPLQDPDPAEVHAVNDHMGWEPQGDGKWFYGLNVENGRIKDDERIQLKTALREICRTYRPGIRLTAHQSILFTGIDERDRAGIEEILRRRHVPLTEEISTVRRWSMACVAWPTCGLSITEAERALPGIIDQMEVALARLGLESEKFTVRMTGCPNGCARPYNADIGLVGKTAGKYTVLLGGRLVGNRLNFVYKDLVPEGELTAALQPVFAYYKQDRQQGESFGDFCARKGQADLAAYADSHPSTA